MYSKLSKAIFAVLLIASIHFYLERTVFLDISFHLFYLMEGDFAIQNSRFVAFMTQLFPLTGISLGLSLKSILILYSMAFVIVPFFIFLLIRNVVKDKELSLLLALSTFWISTDTFFWIQSELPQGLWVLVLYFALLRKALIQEITFPVQLSVLFLLTLIIVFAHPLIIFPFLYCFIFFGLKYKRTQLIWSQIGIYFSLLVIKQLFFKSSYDGQAMGGLKNFSLFFPDYLSLDTNVQFLKYLLNDYYLLLLGAIAVTIFYIKEKNWKQLINFLAFSGFFLLLINVTYAGKSPEKFYIENLYLPLGIILLFPLILDVFSKIKQQRTLSLTLACLFLVRMLDIYSTAPQYTERVDYLESISEVMLTNNTAKIVTPASNVDLKKLKMNWGFTYEMWLISTLKSGQTISITLEEQKDQFQWTIGRNDAFITNWGVFDYKNLDSRYFIFPDSTKPYLYLDAPFNPKPKE